MNPKIFPHHEPDLAGIILGTNFNRFQSGSIGGLAKENVLRLEILAVHNDGQRGEFGKWMALCMETYDEICVWHIGSPRLEQILFKHGFKPHGETFQGEELDGMRWQKLSACNLKPSMR